MRELDFDAIRSHLPAYLSGADRSALISGLKVFISGSGVSITDREKRSAFSEDLKPLTTRNPSATDWSNRLQGDGWSGLSFYNHDAGSLLTRKCMVLSNSCDVDPANPRNIPTRITFSPLVKFSALQTLVERSSKTADQKRNWLELVKLQKIDNLIYLPEGGALDQSYVVRLDDIHSMPMSNHQMSDDAAKHFSLSNTGFYLLLFKLSVHFCRMHEGINRDDVESEQ